ncbi:hypothetical protein HETIRDRAFT_414501 [Heterobasidion irregulare TC 32-1]|uniref:Uncharacterized protein n=1 Tax=Heterobasidion irregulare (strain TC 32-1) TaxID=747525 RepID=W4KHZ6_HETIT|nr:uncharacterized protein HETIRDRAFT_414501 [Heterobasidion irregulare TC 32-1]ETW85483.1 hypothetical protein HETIRDRAFT_414501 [Heterobasidion irregulare TC 32-1]
MASPPTTIIDQKRPLSCAASLCRQSSAIRLCYYNNREVRFTKTHVSMALTRSQEWIHTMHVARGLRDLDIHERSA